MSYSYKYSPHKKLTSFPTELGNLELFTFLVQVYTARNHVLYLEPNYEFYILILPPIHYFLHLNNFLLVNHEFFCLDMKYAPV